MTVKASPEHIKEVQQTHNQQYPLATRVNMLLTETAVNQSNAINNLHREQDLKLTSLSLLYDIVSHGGTTTQKDLADYFPYTKQAMTLAVNFLEEQGYVIRERDVEDRRVKHISITEKGLTAAQDALVIRQNFYEKMSEILPDEEAETLVTLLGKLDQFYKNFF